MNIERSLIMSHHNFLNPAKMVADSISNIHTNNIGICPKSGLNKNEHVEVEKQCDELFDKVRAGDLDFITDALTAHSIILNNISTICLKKAKSGDYFKEYTELSIKATDQLRKTGLALAQIKNVIQNISHLSTTLSIQQQNNLRLTQAREELEEVKELLNVKKLG